VTRHWTKRRIIEEIQRIGREGQDLSQKAVMRSHGALLSAAKSSRYFGTWRKAIEAAGLDYGKVRRPRGRQARPASSSRARAHGGAGEAR
jgi:hypothetical protein